MRQTPVSLRDEATKKRRNYMRNAFEVQTFRKKMKMLQATSDFPCCNCACLPKSFIHTEEKRKSFSLMVFQANVFSHVMERTPVLGYPRRVVMYVHVSSRNITCVYKALSTVVSHSTSSLQLRFELIFFLFYLMCKIFLKAWSCLRN